ncbi:putative RNA recognition motif domain, nucleotide-binding alpha-beta plait domain superfamily [Helianthus anomalus]
MFIIHVLDLIHSLHGFPWFFRSVALFPRCSGVFFFDGVAGYEVFVANIPEGCRPWDLASVLKDFGDLTRTYIARKRNKDGLKFGFVSFRGVKEWKEMENKLKGIKLRKNTLNINLARFAKENGPAENGGPLKGTGSVDDRKDVPSNMKKPFSFTRPGCSYNMALNVEKPTSPVVEEIMVSEGVSALGSRMHRSLLIRARYFNSLVTIKQLFSAAGFKEVDLQYVAAVNFLSRGGVWKVWFSHADIWIRQAVAYERMAWLRVHGVPLHLYCDEVFLDICNRYGFMVKPPQISEEDGDLSMMYVGVLVGEGKRILEEVTLNWQDKKYRVWVSEDLGDWLPDCLDEDGDSVESDDVDSIFESEFKLSEA